LPRKQILSVAQSAWAKFLGPEMVIQPVERQGEGRLIGDDTIVVATPGKLQPGPLSGKTDL